MIVVGGIWPALPLTGNLLLLRHYRRYNTYPFPFITSFCLMIVAGIVIWSAPMLITAIIGIYRAEFFGLLGWAIALIYLINVSKKQHTIQFINLKPSQWDWLFAVGLVLAAGLYLGFPTESILGGRDQGVYANHGIFIAQHGRLDIPYPWMLDESLKQVVTGFPRSFLPGLYLTSPNMTVQFAHLFPVWLAQAFSSFGHYGLFRLNGILALLFIGIFYGLCRIVMPKPHAIVATIFLALNPSQIWLARITLTEILTQLFIWSSLLILLWAIKAEDQTLARWAGFFLGFSALVRIDSLLLVSLLLFSDLLIKIVAFEELNRKKISSVFTALYQTALPGFALAICYYALYSKPYFLALSSQVAGLSLVALFALCLMLAVNTKILKLIRSLLTSKIILNLLSVAFFGLVAYAYLIRPHVMPYSIINLPKLPNNPLNGTRDYSEDSLVNLAQYLSPLIIWTAIVGWLATLWAIVGKKHQYLVPVLVVSMGFGALYIWKPSISPDHFWAIRRFVPVVIPGFVFFAALGTRWLLARLSQRWYSTVLASVLIFLSIFTLQANALIFAFAENKGCFIQIQQIAERLPQNKLILAQAGVQWITPLYIAFNRKVFPVDLNVNSSKNVLDNWISKQTNEQTPVYLVFEGKPALKGLHSRKLGETVISRSYSEPTVHPLPKKIVEEKTTISSYEVKGIQADYKDSPLGAEMVWGVEESGFYGQEWHGSTPFRWTNGMAKLVVPLSKQNLPQALKVELESTAPKGTKLAVRVNNYELFDGQIGSGSWSKTFSLANVTLGEKATIELLSDTWIPKQLLKDNQDSRNLGVSVSAIKLLAQQSIGTKVHE